MAGNTDHKCYIRFFAAMSDVTRQKIVLLLRHGDLCVNELHKHFTVSQPTISRHLSILKNAGIVQDQRCGQQVVYSLNPESVRDCCSGFMSKFDCCGESADSVDFAPQRVSAAENGQIQGRRTRR